MVFGDNYLEKHEKTMERRAILESHGIKVVEMWEREWDSRKTSRATSIEKI